MAASVAVSLLLTTFCFLATQHADALTLLTFFAISIVPVVVFVIAAKKVVDSSRGDQQYPTLFLPRKGATPVARPVLAVSQPTAPVVDVRVLRGPLLASLRRETNLLLLCADGRGWSPPGFRNLPEAELHRIAAQLKEALQLHA